MRKKMLVVLAAGLIITGTMVGFHEYRQRTKESESMIYKIYQIKQPENLTFKGKTEEDRQQVVTINSDYGSVKTIHVLDGQNVNAGDIMLTYSGYGNRNSIQKEKREKEQYEIAIEKWEEEKNAIFQEKKN